MPGWRQLVSHAGRLRRPYALSVSCSEVVRTPHALGIHAPEHQAKPLEALFALSMACAVGDPSFGAARYGLLLPLLPIPIR